MGLARSGRQEEAVPGGVDFSGCVTDPDTGLCCVDKEETVTSLEKEPILECTHKNVEQCHYTYVTQFTPSQEEVCEENFEKQCSITFKQQAYNETVKKCYKPVEKVCKVKVKKSVALFTSLLAQPSTLKSNLVNLSVILLVKSSQLKFAELVAPLKKERRSVMIKLLFLLLMFPRKFVT